jgi:hypothetical protein
VEKRRVTEQRVCEVETLFAAWNLETGAGNNTVIKNTEECDWITIEIMAHIWS